MPGCGLPGSGGFQSEREVAGAERPEHCVCLDMLWIALRPLVFLVVVWYPRAVGLVV